MRTLLCMVLCVGAYAGEADVLPATAKATCEKMDKALNEVRAKAILELKGQVAACEKKSDLTGADAILGKIAEIQAAIDASKPQVPNALGIPPILIGKWRVTTQNKKYNAIWEFKADGTLKREEGTGTFKIEGTVIKITWSFTAGLGTMEMPTGPKTRGRSTGGEEMLFEKR